MKLGYTIHQITAKDYDFAPGEVSPFPDAEYDTYLKMGALRAPTDTELALYRLAHPSVEAEVSDDRGALVERATALGIKFNKNVSDETLRLRIAEAETL